MRTLCRYPISSSYSAGADPPRRAITVFEVIVMLPVLLILLAAITEFGLILANTKFVSLASRNAARVAAEMRPLNISAVESAANSVLATAEIRSCRIILEHTVPAGGDSPVTSGTCNCAAPIGPSLPAAGGNSPGAVRVTVCVELSELTPNLLAAFGFSTANRTVKESTVYPYEL